MSVEFESGPVVINDLSVEVAAGSYVLIAGPTGSGKSTLALALIGALSALTGAQVRGRVEICGTEISAALAAERSRLIAAVWQHPAAQLYRPTVLEEVRAGLDNQLMPSAEGDHNAREALRMAGLAHLPESQDPATLSGGEQQRLALAAALALQTPVLVLDEATSALDSAAAEQFSQALARVRSERQITVIAVDHRPDVHLGHADRLLILNEGRIVVDAAPEAIYLDQPEEATRWGLRLPGGGAESSRSVPTAADNAAGATAIAAGATAALSIEGVHAVRSGRTILSEVNARMSPGAVTLVVGDNGAGKSTLLNILSAHLRPSGGQIWPRTRQRIREGTGFAPQRAGDLMLANTVLQEVCSVLARGRSHSDHHVEEHARALLGDAALSEQAQAHPLRLSGGQRQRLGVLLALAGDPAFVLLDEPTSAQDQRGADVVMELIRTGIEHRVTIIVTHEPAGFLPIATSRLTLSATHGVGT